MKPVFPVLALALMAFGCAPREEALPRSEADTETLMASTTHVWMAFFDGEKGGLSYAVPETDAIIMSLDCVKHSGRATITALTDDAARPLLVIWEGDRAREWPAKLVWDDAAGSNYAIAEISLSEPALANLRDGLGFSISRPAIGPLSVESAPERREIERFFAFCDR